MCEYESEFGTPDYVERLSRKELEADFYYVHARMCGLESEREKAEKDRDNAIAENQKLQKVVSHYAMDNIALTKTIAQKDDLINLLIRRVKELERGQ